MGRLDTVEQNLTDTGIPMAWVFRLALEMVYYFMVGYALYKGASFAGMP